MVRKIPRQAITANGGPQPSGMHRTADYKRGKALKSCFTEFCQIRNAAMNKRVLGEPFFNLISGQQDFLIFAKKYLPILKIFFTFAPQKMICKEY